jgi:hypothetical protein
LATLPARANLMVGVQSVTANAGSTGNQFEVFLTNTGAPVTVASFTFGITTSAPGITFTGAFTSTTPDPYIFAGHSLFGPEIDTATGTTLEASDIYDVPLAGATVGTGATVGLGEVFFDVAAGTPGGPATVSVLSSPFTSLSDPALNDIPIDTFGSGTITVIPGATTVPEPSTLLLAALSGPAVAWLSWRRRRAARAPS